MVLQVLDESLYILIMLYVCQAIRPEEDCQLNERYVECGKCESTCEDPKRACPFGCLQSRCECVSADGFVRSRHGACILASECSARPDIRSGEYHRVNNEVDRRPQAFEPLPSNRNVPSTGVSNVINTAAVQPQGFQMSQQRTAAPAWNAGILPQQVGGNPTISYAVSFQQQPAAFNVGRRASAFFTWPQQNWIPQQQLLYVQNTPNRPVYYMQNPSAPFYSQKLQYVPGKPRSGVLSFL